MTGSDPLFADLAIYISTNPQIFNEGSTISRRFMTCQRSFAAEQTHELCFGSRGDMRSEVTRKLFTIDEYYKMAEAGIFDEDSRVELIEGEIIEMSPVGSRHIACVNRANELFVLNLAERVIVSPQNPVRLSNITEPQPDLVLLKRRADYYTAKRLSAEDTYLVIEVSDTTFRYDRNRKLPLYAKYGVQEVWIEDLKKDVILVFRDLADSEYSTSLVFRPGDSISLSAFPDVLFKVEDLLCVGR